MTTNNHPAHGPLSLDRLHQIHGILSKASAQSDGGNLGYAMADAVKVIYGAIAAFGSEPVLYAAEETLAYAKMGELHLKCLSQPMGDAVIPLYTAPPAQVVPSAMTREEYRRRFMMEDNFDDTYRGGWNACRAAMLQGTDGKPELTVWYGSMPETNGKTNWTAMLHRKGQHPWEGITIDRSEYPDRVRYEADRMRHLIGELADEPDILAYDADAHSGYVNPGNSPVTPDCWIPVSERMPDKLIPVMVMYADGEMWSAMWSGQFWDDGCTIPDPHAITHWREMPSAPQQEVNRG